jgi:two-component system LytT family sensor kinase
VAVVLNALAVQAVQQHVLPAGPVPVTYAERVGLTLVAYGFFLFSVYCAIVAVQHAALYYRAFRTRALEAARLEARLAHAQLDVLRMQLQPHFLFNTLNTVASLMTRDLPAAHATLVRLGELLRRSLEDGAGHEGPLRDELEFLDQYLEIQRARFRDRLRVEVDVEPAALDVDVPRLILQPLVENAIRHGVQEREGPGCIRVRGRRENGRLRLEVVDDGPGLGSGEPGGGGNGGIGLANTRARLAQLYGDEHVFRVENGENGGVRVRLEIPARVAETTAEFVEV